ncbi:hypothetical protein C5S39_07080 [Candidatus Methanophagaceae archaeon]|jgi:hypothetical protein|nr:hypothetical protein C5S39_07080 [Methanophagales archaeon]
MTTRLRGIIGMRFAREQVWILQRSIYGNCILCLSRIIIQGKDVKVLLPELLLEEAGA